MKKSVNQRRAFDDFATLLAWAWYQDFPVDSSWRLKTNGHADWTLHVATSVRFSAAQMGYFLHCEDAARTDGIIRNNKGDQIAAVEWEWNELSSAPPYNEIAKLKTRVAAGGFACLVCYVHEQHLTTQLANVAASWQGTSGPLLLVTITFEESRRTRNFRRIQMFRFNVNGRIPAALRDAPALPWELSGTRWERQDSSDAET